MLQLQAGRAAVCSLDPVLVKIAKSKTLCACCRFLGERGGAPLQRARADRKLPPQVQE